jgi:predicted ABC-type ATPase
MKEIILIGGPNGAGKTTAAAHLLPRRLKIMEFVNADEIARGLSPFNEAGAAFAAGRVMLGRMAQFAQAGQSFAFETTCASLTPLRLIEGCKREGWRFTLIYLWLPSAEAAAERVARRVEAGGHDIPWPTIERRYRGGIANMLRHYLPLADIAAIYDNSDQGRTLIAEKTQAGAFRVGNTLLWDRIRAVAA